MSLFGNMSNTGLGSNSLFGSLSNNYNNNNNNNNMNNLGGNNMMGNNMMGNNMMSNNIMGNNNLGINTGNNMLGGINSNMGLNNNINTGGIFNNMGTNMMNSNISNNNLGINNNINNLNNMSNMNNINSTNNLFGNSYVNSVTNNKGLNTNNQKSKDTWENINCVPFDYVVNDKIDDTIQTIKFHQSNDPSNQIFSAGGWDSILRIYSLKYNVLNLGTAPSTVSGIEFSLDQYKAPQVDIQVGLLTSKAFTEPILSSQWINNTVYVSDTEGGIYSFDLNTSGIMKIGGHNAGCKELVHYNNMNLLISGGWDNFIHFWDLRSPNPAISLNMNNKIYSMSLTRDLFVVGMDKLRVCYFNMGNLRGNFNKEAEFNSHLKYQTKSIATFSDGSGYSIGSIEGRVACKNVFLDRKPIMKDDVMTTEGDFAFRCHRSGQNKTDVYAINSIAYNPTYGTFATGGGDGEFCIWDRISKAKLKTGSFQDNAPITSLQYSNCGNILVYASGYDWAKGIYGEGLYSNKIGVHYLPDCEKVIQQKKK